MYDIWYLHTIRSRTLPNGAYRMYQTKPGHAQAHCEIEHLKDYRSSNLTGRLDRCYPSFIFLITLNMSIAMRPSFCYWLPQVWQARGWWKFCITAHACLSYLHYLRLPPTYDWFTIDLLALKILGAHPISCDLEICIFKSVVVQKAEFDTKEKLLDILASESRL